ncbi:hypothetical protein B9Z65_2144 [Elsinoe australis]|uniref:RRM domain-containing protein n=1 Tax=Elsinoe australis TaxID=40998 RepID=A0A2P7YN55_9PEZI|nr:hypothetical protein B9Z65_2144 [Elsinoe australis]
MPPPPHKKQRQSLTTPINPFSTPIAAPSPAPKPESPTAAEDDTKSPPPSTNPRLKADPNDPKHRRTLFIRSLPPSTTTEALTALFSQSRPIKHATAVLDTATGQCKGYGFVTYADAEDAEAARGEFHGFTLKGELGEEVEEEVDEQGRKKKGRRLRVEVAEPRRREKTSKVLPGVDGEEGEEADGVRAKREDAAKEKRLARDLETGSKVIVRNLPWSVKSGEQLGKYFEKFGKVKGAVVPKKNGGLLQGFGFVTFKSRKAAEKAIKEANGVEIEGRSVAVDWAVQREVWKGLEEKNEEEEEDGGVEVKTEDEDEGEMDEVDGVDAGLDEDTDGEGENDDDEAFEDEEDEEDQEEDRSSTLFIRNLPFTATDEDLEEVFRPFGAVRYARVVMDYATARPKGTGFVCFYEVSDADECLRHAPRHIVQKHDEKTKPTSMSVLQDETLDPTGRYTLDGRVLHVSRAVDKREANRLTEHGVAQRFNRDKDRRRLYLLQEGTIRTDSELWQRMSPTERQLRDASVKQRKTLIESNPSLHLSLTRLSIRNIPRSVTSMDLKQLAREAVVGFATDVKEGKRQRLSKEELSRGGEEMREAERVRRESKKGIVKQAKIVFEGREGGKVEEKSGAGRSRGYGFIEYHTHRNALMGLRWLNGHLIDYKALSTVKEGKGKPDKEVLEDRKKRMIVEFAIENAQVVQRRKEKEDKARERSKLGNPNEEAMGGDKSRNGKGGKFDKKNGKNGKFDKKDSKFDKKRKRGNEDEEKSEGKQEEDEKLAKRARIIQKKRMMRRAKKNGKPFKV